jgi:hypothetical protein
LYASAPRRLAGTFAGLRDGPPKGGRCPHRRPHRAEDFW